MSSFKRFCMFLFGLSGLVCFIVLALSQYGIAVDQIAIALAIPWVFVTFQVCLGITVCGLIFFFFGALFAPRSHRSVVISSVGDDEIQVTRNAIKAQAVHIIERDGSMVAKNVTVHAKRQGHICVFARVQPSRPVNVVEAGERLHEDLERGLADVCGDKVESVGLEFIDAASQEDLTDHVEPLQASTEPLQEAAPEAESATGRAASSAQGSSDDITVAIGRSSSSLGAAAEDKQAKPATDAGEGA